MKAYIEERGGKVYRFCDFKTDYLIDDEVPLPRLQKIKKQRNWGSPFLQRKIF